MGSFEQSKVKALTQVQMKIEFGDAAKLVSRGGL